MKLITSTSAAVIVATLGLGAMAPAAFAQDQGPQAGPGDKRQMQQQFRFHNRDGQRGGLLQLVCSDQGAERLEHMFVNLSHRVELTAEQTPLFDALKTAALSAQTEFSDTCASVRPAAGETAEMPNLVERLQTRIKIDEARIAALSAVVPSLEAFYNGLTDEQKAKLDVRPGEMRREHFGKHQGDGPDRRPGLHRQLMNQNG